MINRKALTIGLLIVATLSLSACSDNSSDKSDDTTTTVADTATTVAGTDGSTIAPEDTAPEQSFDEGLASTRASIETAGDDPCALTGALASSASLGQPANLGEAIETLNLLEEIYLELADLAPTDLSAEKATIQASFKLMIDEANSDTTDEATYLSEGPTASSDEKFTAALEAIQTAATAECSDIPTEDTSG